LVSIIVVLVLALLIAGAIAYSVARSITQPLGELVSAARAVAEGRFDHSIAPRSQDEVGQLAGAFNDMTERLKATVTELSSSRDRLQRAIERVGETLRSTHDMRQIYEAILNTAADAVGADAAMLWRLNRTRDELYPIVGRGLTTEDYERIRVGTGLVGHVAERGMPILRPVEVGPKASRDEPSYPVVVAVPLYTHARISGVISLYRDDETKPFRRGDLETVSFLAEQGGVAMENVQLHEEAQRLSITDGLTGVWNRRYFQMQFRQVLATSLRFGRSFSVLMLDLDHFKEVNDTYGHQRGDAILIEFAQRVKRTLREVDTFARYGGEEFICLLPETDVRGALITAEKTLETIRSEPFGGIDEQSLNLTVSIGLASYPQHGESYSEVVEAADQALYRAKQEGRNRARVAQSPPPNLKLAT
jgi:diguanylate cyclase (GGDEF)-like protein